MAGTREPAAGWWEQRWLEYIWIEAVGWEPPETRLRSARRARAQVTLVRGRVTAEVEVGSSGRTATATLKVKPLTEREWRRVLDAVAADAEVSHRLLSGNPGPELEEALQSVGVELFPQSAGGYPLRCTCRERLDCRHALVLAVQTADLLTGNPFLWLQVLGRDRAEVLAALRARLADRPDATPGKRGKTPAGAQPAEPPLALELFWATAVDPQIIAVTPGHSAAPDALLRRLGPLPLARPAAQVTIPVEKELVRGDTAWQLWDQEDQPVEELLRRYVVEIARGAAALAAGEQPSEHTEAPLPGKPVPVGARLAVEVAEVARREPAPVAIERLLQACPTAAALPGPQARRAFADSVADLPPEIIGLAGRYVCERTAFLSALVFRHVISFGEWRAGALQAGADWERVLALGGVRPPYRVQVGGQVCTVPDLAAPEPSGPWRSGGLFDLLEPEVGDELQLAVADPGDPLLVATLHRRDQRSVTAPLETDRAAAWSLFDYMQDNALAHLSEGDAVAVLAGEGYYRPGRIPDAVWLLTAMGEGLYSQGGTRWLTRSHWRAWEPRFGRLFYSGNWRDRGSLMRWFEINLTDRGADSEQAEAALACVGLWCEYWPGEQDRPGHSAPLAAFLDFLWNLAPLATSKYGWPAELVPEVLGHWFAFLGERNPAMRAAYREHLAACGLTAAYARRLHTLPGERGGGALAWRLEGYRWMGSDCYFT